MVKLIVIVNKIIKQCLKYLPILDFNGGQYEWSFTDIGHWVYTLRTFNPQGLAGYSEIINNGVYGLNNYYP